MANMQLEAFIYRVTLRKIYKIDWSLKIQCQDFLKILHVTNHNSQNIICFFMTNMKNGANQLYCKAVGEKLKTKKIFELLVKKKSAYCIEKPVIL